MIQILFQAFFCDMGHAMPWKWILDAGRAMRRQSQSSAPLALFPLILAPSHLEDA